MWPRWSKLIDVGGRGVNITQQILPEKSFRVLTHQPPNSTKIWPSLVKVGQHIPDLVTSVQCSIKFDHAGQCLAAFGDNYSESPPGNNSKCVGICSGRLSGNRHGGECSFEYCLTVSPPPPPSYPTKSLRTLQTRTIPQRYTQAGLLNFIDPLRVARQLWTTCLRLVSFFGRDPCFDWGSGR